MRYLKYALFGMLAEGLHGLALGLHLQISLLALWLVGTRISLHALCGPEVCLQYQTLAILFWAVAILLGLVFALPLTWLQASLTYPSLAKSLLGTGVVAGVYILSFHAPIQESLHQRDLEEQRIAKLNVDNRALQYERANQEFAQAVLAMRSEPDYDGVYAREARWLLEVLADPKRSGPPGEPPPMLAVVDRGGEVEVSLLGDISVDLALSRVQQSNGRWELACPLRALDPYRHYSPAHRFALSPASRTRRLQLDSDCLAAFQTAPIEFRVGRVLATAREPVWWSHSTLDAPNGRVAPTGQ